MRWPWHRHTTGGREAREQAQQDLERMREQTANVRKLADSLRDIRERNHIAEAIEVIYLGRKS